MDKILEKRMDDYILCSKCETNPCECKILENWDEEKVKERSLRKYTCKKNKGEHEWGEPIVKHRAILYIYKTPRGEMHSGTLCPEYKLKGAKVSFFSETHCKHCNKKATNYFSDKLV